MTGLGVCAAAIGVCVALLVREDDNEKARKVEAIRPPSDGAKARRVVQCGRKGCNHHA